MWFVLKRRANWLKFGAETRRKRRFVGNIAGYERGRSELKTMMQPQTTIRVKLTDINPHLLCVLCHGYLVDATTIVECLHSFCRSCIVRHLEANKTCPRCDVLVHKTKPLINLRLDRTLQTLVYKLVPELFQNEKQRRRQFYASRPEAVPTSGADSGDIEESHLMYTEDEKISLCLQHCDRLPSLKYGAGRSNSALKPAGDKEKDKRYLLCPALVTIACLKKFIQMKFDLSPHLQVEIFHSDESLKGACTLMDIANIYSWKRTKPLTLYYIVFDKTQLSLEMPEPTDVPLDSATIKQTTAKKRPRKRSDDRKSPTRLVKSRLFKPPVTRDQRRSHDSSSADVIIPSVTDRDHCDHRDTPGSESDSSCRNRDPDIRNGSGIADTADPDNSSDNMPDCVIVDITNDNKPRNEDKTGDKDNMDTTNQTDNDKHNDKHNGVTMETDINNDADQSDRSVFNVVMDTVSDESAVSALRMTGCHGDGDTDRKSDDDEMSPSDVKTKAFPVPEADSNPDTPPKSCSKKRNGVSKKNNKINNKKSKTSRSERRTNKKARKAELARIQQSKHSQIRPVEVRQDCNTTEEKTETETTASTERPGNEENDEHPEKLEASATSDSLQSSDVTLTNGDSVLCEDVNQNGVDLTKDSDASVDCDKQTTPGLTVTSAEAEQTIGEQEVDLSTGKNCHQPESDGTSDGGQEASKRPRLVNQPDLIQSTVANPECKCKKVMESATPSPPAYDHKPTADKQSEDKDEEPRSPDKGHDLDDTPLDLVSSREVNKQRSSPTSSVDSGSSGPSQSDVMMDDSLSSPGSQTSTDRYHGQHVNSTTTTTTNNNNNINNNNNTPCSTIIPLNSRRRKLSASTRDKAKSINSIIKKIEERKSKKTDVKTSCISYTGAETIVTRTESQIIAVPLPPPANDVMLARDGSAGDVGAQTHVNRSAPKRRSASGSRSSPEATPIKRLKQLVGDVSPDGGAAKRPRLPTGCVGVGQQIFLQQLTHATSGGGIAMDPRAILHAAQLQQLQHKQQQQQQQQHRQRNHVQHQTHHHNQQQQQQQQTVCLSVQQARSNCVNSVVNRPPACSPSSLRDARPHPSPTVAVTSPTIAVTSYGGLDCGRRPAGVGSAAHRHADNGLMGPPRPEGGLPRPAHTGPTSYVVDYSANSPLANGYDQPLELTTKKSRDRKSADELPDQAKPPITTLLKIPSLMKP